jgi:hypothetical protein
MSTLRCWAPRRRCGRPRNRDAALPSMRGALTQATRRAGSSQPLRRKEAPFSAAGDPSRQAFGLPPSPRGGGIPALHRRHAAFRPWPLFKERFSRAGRRKSGGGRGCRAFLSNFYGAVSRVRPVCFPPSRPSSDRAGRYVRLPCGFSTSPAHSRLHRSLGLSGAPLPSDTATLGQKATAAAPDTRCAPGPPQQSSKYRPGSGDVDKIFFDGPATTFLSPHRRAMTGA